VYSFIFLLRFWVVFAEWWASWRYKTNELKNSTVPGFQGKRRINYLHSCNFTCKISAIITGNCVLCFHNKKLGEEKTKAVADFMQVGYTTPFFLHKNLNKNTVFDLKILQRLFSIYKNIKVIRKSASFLVKFDLGPHQTFVILPFHFPC
jgi:hypothetical protein